jgi:hypothetical protein
MPATITTEVYTLDELVERGDERAVDNAMSWMADAWEDVATEQVSEYLADALRAANLPGLTVTGWDYWQSNVDIEGEVTAHDLAHIPPGHFLGGVKFPHIDWIDRVSFGTRRAMDYGHDVWIDMAEDAPFGWASVQYADLIADAIDWQRGIEHALAKRMIELYGDMTSRDYLLECAEANGYTFTADGKRFG